MKNQAVLRVMEALLRKALPKDFDFTLTIWRMPQDNQLEMWSVSRGNPDELEIVLKETLREVTMENLKPLSSVH